MSSFEAGFQFLLERPWASLTSLVVAGLVVYYHLKVVAPVKFICKKGSQLEKLFRKSLPVANEMFKPTIWCFEARFQTIFASVCRAFIPDIPYRREILKLSDGGEVGLDWLDNDKDGSSSEKEYSGPIILFLPGLTGDSQSEYIKSFINVAHRDLNAKCVVFNFRGRGGHAITTPKTYCAANGDDLNEVLCHIKSLHPKAPVMAVGVSLGGILLSNYLSQEGEKARNKLVAAMVISVCFDCFKGTESLEKYGMNRMLNRHLASCLVDSIKEVRHHFDSNALYNLEKVFSSGTIREFDSTFTAPLFGYSDVKEYYTNATIAGKIHKIRVPYLALNAEDDPFQPGDSLPYEEVAQSDYASMLSTKYGGHIGFMEGFFPSRYHFSDRVFQQYAGAVFHHLDEFLTLNQEKAP